MHALVLPSRAAPADKVTVQHVLANQAPKGRRRTYRAHGRINAYMSVPAHLEMILVQQAEPVEKPAEAKPPRLHRRVLAARGVVPVGGGAE
jgi:large subunit ribosomal protein L17e